MGADQTLERDETDIPAPARRTEAIRLIRSQRTMVLSTHTPDAPWAAPVYYVYRSPGFYFFSSPRSRHINQGLNSTSAAVIYADSDQWEQIQGLQMTGKLQLVSNKIDRIKMTGHFLLKFPFAKSFLKPDQAENKLRPAIGEKVNMYVFFPGRVYYLNNRLGFGERLPVDLSSDS